MIFFEKVSSDSVIIVIKLLLFKLLINSTSLSAKAGATPSKGSSNNLGPKKKKSYQMDYNNNNEALKEVSMDIKEGADIILIKPGMPYLDVLNKIKIHLIILPLAIKYQENILCL